MKKVLALILALVCAFSLVACDGNDAETEGQEPIAALTPAQQAQLAADRFMDALVALDIEAMKACVDNPEAGIVTAFKSLDKAVILESVPEQYAAYDAEFEEIVEVLIEKITSNMSYAPKDNSEENGKFTFNYEITVPDFSQADIGTLLTDAMQEEALGSIVMDLITSGNLSATSSQEDIMAAAVPKVLEVVKDAIGQMTFETNTETAKVVVVEIDGNWIVDTAASGM